MGLKDWLKGLAAVGIEVNRALDGGLSVGGLNFSRARHAPAPRSEPALLRCIDLRPQQVLDVGSGGGEHATRFAAAGAEVTCIDFGTSIYAAKAQADAPYRVVYTDFNTWSPDSPYDLVWASHVLEHQRNVGLFLERLVAACRAGGHIAITLPSPHRRLWGGHLTLWTPGLLAYNLVLCGLDLSGATILYGYREFSIIFSPLRIQLPELTQDSGDLDRLARYMPGNIREDSDPWIRPSN